MRRIRILILSLFCMTANVLYSAEFVATVTAYNKADLFGEVPDGIEVSFINTNASKGKITAGKKATMTLSHIPDIAITRIELYVRSNAKSGAGSVLVTLNGEAIGSIATSSYSDWHGTGFSTEYLPFGFDGLWLTTAESELVCEISASENSLDWEKVRVIYSEVETAPNTLTLCWLDATGKSQKTTLTESSVGVGIVLPKCSVTTLQADEEWVFVGWSAAKITTILASKPVYFEVGEKYYPAANEALFAVYTNVSKTKNITQATQFTTGEYAIVAHVLDDYIMLYGEVNKKVVLGKYCAGSINSKGLYQLDETYVPDDNRYYVTFDDDKLWIQHLQSGEYIGYNNNVLANKNVAWDWTERLNHSLEVYFDRKMVNDEYELRILYPNIRDEPPVFEAQLIKEEENFEYLLFFDVSDVPIAGFRNKWTGYPFGWDQIETVSTNPQARKIIRNGVIYIEYNGAEYDIFGHKYE